MSNPLYPSNVPDYNQFRFPTPDTLDTGTLETCYLSYPRDLRGLLFGAMSLLSEINCMVSDGAVTPEEVVDAYNNFVGCGELNCDDVIACLTDANGLRVEDCLLLLGDTVIADLTICGNAPADAAPDDLTELEQMTDDATCGAAVSIVDGLIDVGGDWLDLFQAAVSGFDAIAKVLDVFDALPVKQADLVSAIASLFDDIGTAGIAFVRSELNNNANRLNLICDIDYQIRCVDNGTFVIENVRQAILDASYGAAVTEALIQQVQAAWSDKTLTRYALIGQSEGDAADCVTCAACPQEWCYEYDYRTSDAGMTTSSPTARALYVPGEGWRTINYFSGQQYTRMSIVSGHFLPSTVQPDKIEIDYTMSGSNRRRIDIRAYESGSQVDDVRDDNVPDGTGVLTLTMDGATDIDEIRYLAETCVPCWGGEATIHGVRVYGTGIDPAWSSGWVAC